VNPISRGGPFWTPITPPKGSFFHAESQTGTVESIAPASGSEFSILPAQNSSGNWVKVVQRIPLRIGLERQPGQPPCARG
jgi:multidrug resistance efflux pump